MVLSSYSVDRLVIASASVMAKAVLRKAIPFLLTLVANLTLSIGGDQLQAAEKLRAVYNAIGTGQSPLWIPHEAGIFRKYGVDVELLYVGSGSRTAQVVVSGEAPIGMFNGGLVVNANLAGADLVVVADGLNVLPFFLVTAPRIKNINELKGQKIGITRFGSATEYALRYAAEKGSLRLGKETPVLQLGGQPEMMAALKNGLIEAAVLNPEFAILAAREGFNRLVDIGALGLAFPTSSLNTSRTFIQKKRDMVRQFVRAYVEGIHYAKTHRQFAIDVLRRYLRNEDVAFVAAVYEIYIVRLIPRVAHPSADAMRTVLSQLALKDPKIATISPEQFLDRSFLQELEKERFIETLWK
ncbi:MAG: ABC transporter substrate-binding protein [Deltaproteobacteria bacterium]|nr:ABC transporter substrate-binding protein [Deltaproteobacteria bacterium]